MQIHLSDVSEQTQIRTCYFPQTNATTSYIEIEIQYFVIWRSMLEVPFLTVINFDMVCFFRTLLACSYIQRNSICQDANYIAIAFGRLL
jgi:hypothetical protein